MTLAFLQGHGVTKKLVLCNQSLIKFLISPNKMWCVVELAGFASVCSWLAFHNYCSRETTSLYGFFFGYKVSE